MNVLFLGCAVMACVEIEPECFVVCLPGVDIRPGGCFWVQQQCSTTSGAKMPQSTQVLIPVDVKPIADTDSLDYLASFVPLASVSLSVQNHVTFRCQESRLIPKQMKKKLKKVPLLVVDSAFRDVWTPRSSTVNFYFCLTPVTIISKQGSIAAAPALPHVDAYHHRIFSHKFGCFIAEGPLSCFSVSSPWSRLDNPWIKLWVLTHPDLDTLLLDELMRRITVDHSIISVTIKDVISTFCVFWVPTAAHDASSRNNSESSFFQCHLEEPFDTPDKAEERRDFFVPPAVSGRRMFDIVANGHIQPFLVCAPSLRDAPNAKTSFSDSSYNGAFPTSSEDSGAAPQHVQHYVSTAKAQVLQYLTNNVARPGLPAIIRSFWPNVNSTEREVLFQGLYHQLKPLCGAVLIHSIRLDVCFASGRHYRQSSVCRLLTTFERGNTATESYDSTNAFQRPRLGGVRTTTVPGSLVSIYCRERIRATIDVLTEALSLQSTLSSDNNSSPRPYLIMMHLEKIEQLTLKEWEEVRSVLRALVAEVEDINISRFPGNVSGVLLYLTANWDSIPSTSALFSAVQCFFSGKEAEQQTVADQALSALHISYQDIEDARRLMVTENLKRLLSNVTHPMVGIHDVVVDTQDSDKRKQGVVVCPSLDTLIKANQRGILSHEQLHRVLRAYQLLMMYCLEAPQQHAASIAQQIQHVLPELVLAIERTKHYSLAHAALSSRSLDNEEKHDMVSESGIFSKEHRRIINDLDFYIFRAINSPETLALSGIHYSPRALLAGPSGSGKSAILGHMIHQYSNLYVVTVDLTALYSPFLGDTEKNLIQAFQQVKSRLPSLLILEGLELLCGSGFTAKQPGVTTRPYLASSCRDQNNDVARTESIESHCLVGDVQESECGSSVSVCDDLNDRGLGDVDPLESQFHRKLLTALLLCLDGIDSSQKNTFGFIGVSRLPPEHLEPALTRPGRLDRWFVVDTERSS